MKRNLGIKIIALVLVLCLASLSFCGCGEKEIKTVRLNEVTHSIFYAPQYVAIELGYFEEEGINIEVTNGGGSNVSMTAVVSKQADVGLVGPETAIYVYNQGKKDYPLVFGQLTKRDGSFLISRSNDVPFDYNLLKGKEVIVGRKGGLPAMTLEYLLNNHGIYNNVNCTFNYDIAFPRGYGAFG